MFKKHEQMDQLIRQKRTGTMKEFAKKLGVSERQIWRYIENIRCLGGEVEYSYEHNSYVYTQSFRYELGSTVEELAEIKGGFSCNYDLIRHTCDISLYWGD